MAGLALGNSLAASSKIRRWRPLQLYSVLEILVAFFGCSVVFVLPMLGDLLRPVWQTLWNYQPTLLGLRFVVSFVILLVRTTAIGLTLPVMIEDPALRQTNFGRAIGFFYGSNTLGAMAGAVLGEACLIRALGIYGTSMAAGSVVCIAAAIAFLVARSDDGAAAEGGRGGVRAVESGDMSPHSKFPLRFDASYRPPWRLLIVSFGTGCVFLALEVIWFRFLRLYVTSSATVFSVMLATVLSGIGLGGVFSGALSKKIQQSALPILLIIAAILTLACYIFFPIPKFAQSEKNLYLESWSQIALISLALMFPVAFLSGIL